jgi:N6-L-threonylcarbamoyladenine synthase
MNETLRPILGIETSCDETAVAILDAAGAILAERVFSQTEAHARFGGVVPEIAARAHLERLPPLLMEALEEAGLAWGDLGGIAATAGPGLIGGLIVGATMGKGLALGRGLPFVGVNHLEAHALTATLPGLFEAAPGFPYLLLLLSGGHCQCVAVRGLGRYERLGTTLDDAVGEAFDKSAKLLGLPWPGGPHLERLAQQGRAGAVPLPLPLLGRPGCDFSFSGLKTAVAQAVAKGFRPEDIAAAFQASVAAVLADRARHAALMLPEATALVVAGGVAANRTLRASLAEAVPLPLLAPPIRLCTDNAVMVAWAGLLRLSAGQRDAWGLAPRPRWPLGELTAP